MSGLANGVTFGHAVDRIWSPSGELLNVQYAPINANTSGNTTVVAAVAGKSIYIISMEFLCAGAVTVEWQSGAGGAVISKGQAFPANGGKVLPFNPAGWGATASGALLNINLSAAVQVSGSIQYAVF
jgi:hypothetical protein